MSSQDDNPRSGGVDPRNSLNDLDGGRWLYFTKSVLLTSYASEFYHAERKIHGANKPPELMKHLIEFFTKPGDRVLDPFAGVGGSLIGAMLCQPPRACVGIEISPQWVKIYSDVADKLDRDGVSHAQARMIQGDCLEVMEDFEAESFQFVVTDPPYNQHFKRTMCNGRYDGKYSNRRTDYNMKSREPGDLANSASYEAYLQSMERVFSSCHRLLERSRYMVAIIRNAYQNGRYIFTHADLAQRASSQGFVPKGEIVWHQAGARLRPYGYPYQFVPNIVHQYILVFWKE